MLAAFDPEDRNHLEELELHAQRAGHRASTLLTQLLSVVREGFSETERLADQLTEAQDNLDQAETGLEQVKEAYQAALAYIDTLQTDDGLPHDPENDEQWRALQAFESMRATYPEFDPTQENTK